MQNLVVNTKDQIETTAKNLFRERGYAATSMRGLANTLGLEAASLYYHVRSKEDILQKICFDMAEAFFEAAASAIEDKRLDPKQQLLLIINAHVKVITSNLDASAVFFHEWRHLSEPRLSDFKKLQKKYESVFANIIREGIKQKVFRNLDVKFAVLTILSALNWTYEWYKPSGKMTSEEIAMHLGSLLIKGLVYEE